MYYLLICILAVLHGRIAIRSRTHKYPANSFQQLLVDLSMSDLHWCPDVVRVTPYLGRLIDSTKTRLILTSESIDAQCDIIIGHCNIHCDRDIYYF